MEEILKLKKEIEDLKKEIEDLKKSLANFMLHTHTGFDSSKIRIQDLEKVIYKQATINPSNLADGAGETIQVTGVTGATLGDYVFISAPYDLQDITVTAYVQSNDTVEVRIQNESGAIVNLDSGTWRILIIKKII
ncbi:hypothetical protein A2125_01465 [Candidatus Woesebacteria bacterium GWB1_43_5]|uniref:Uncharacterized protein n=1 Tax=Candidatus Woesebacteria bacterium GWB1_43_5 TaxID=1802474 RepID=A0A1F7WTF3_9BACT|nr:MAG: hypothetical protein A2125_01465 [Candidatus Woesebacteria bacterium GWB1_43_5]